MRRGKALPDSLSFPIRIYFLDARLDDPKRSTMRKLERFGMARRVSASTISRRVLLWPYAPRFLLAADREKVLRRGLGVVETSWRKIDRSDISNNRNARKLPLLVPVNQVNFGKPGILSSVEAVAAALIIIGERKQADQVLSKFSWAKVFMQTNSQLFSDYISCESDQEVLQVQKEYFGD